MEIRLHGKRALVTGGSRGIGKAIVQKLLECGADVVAVGRNPDNLVALKKEMPKVETVVLDLGTDRDTIRTTISALGVFDLVVNNAGAFQTGPTDEETSRMFGINFFSVVTICEVTSEAMIRAGKSGSIVNISSIGGLRANISGLYGTSKAALNHYTQQLAYDLGPKHIRANAVLPGVTETDMVRDFVQKHGDEGYQAMKSSIPLGCTAVPEDIANVVAFLLSDQARIVTGAMIIADGGQSCHF